MSEVIRIKKGLDIQLKGKAEHIFDQAGLPELFAVKPTDFVGLTPKLVVKEGDQVKAGSVLFFNKYQPDIKFVSPVSGSVKIINRGERRKILEVVIQSDGKQDTTSFGKSDISKLSREEIIKRMLEGGVWPLIRQRPYDIIANPEDTPKAAYISAFDTSPLAPDNDFVVNGQEKYLQAGVDVMNKLAGEVHIGVNGDSASKVFHGLKKVNIHTFTGPHPAGNVGIQLNKVMPINKGDLIWTTQPQDLIIIGKLFLDGIYDSSKIIVLAGSEVKKPAYYRTKIGACIDTIIKGNVNGDNPRYISGNILTGTEIEKDGYLSYYHNQISVIPEGNYYEFLGWAKPGFGKYSVSHSFFTWMCKKKEYALDTNVHGGVRAIVVSGEYDKVLPMDILPEFLIKSILVEDIDKMEQLGIYEVVEEDVALCEFVCTSKLKLQAIVRDGINLMIKELG